MTRFPEIHCVTNNDGTSLLLYNGEQRKMPTRFLEYMERVLEARSGEEAWIELKEMLADRDIRECRRGARQECPWCNEVLPNGYMWVEKNIRGCTCEYCHEKVYIDTHLTFTVRKP